ncbi:MAG: hypothetical protein E7052_02290 [Lentisphaerae bacterium]|nr:hypothetical protein [Lentisphaerota bacterium]
MKILLGGVPFGKGNIGDEAILNCVIGIFRRNFPDAELTVATAAGELTRQKYQVNTLPPFGFDSNLTMRDFRRAARGFDMFVWAGGCGLSDYPHIGASLLENAQKLGLKTVIWQVGMNRELNPDHFQLHGRKQKIADLLGITRYWEKILEKRMRERLQVCVSRCDLVILRDQPSLIELHTSGEFPAALYGADSVVLQKSSERTVLTPDAAGRRSVGICIAEKLNKRKFQQALDFLQMLQQKLNVRLVFIPMTGSDRQLMLALYEKLPDADNKLLLDCTEPDEIQQAISVCSLLISGRLQLTIMALNSLVPGIGIANSSKIANCLSMFGLPVFNNQSDINFNDLMSECERWICDPDFPERAKSVRERMLTRLKQSESYLKDLA